MAGVGVALLNSSGNGNWDNGAQDGAVGMAEDEWDESSSSKLFERSRIRALADEREAVQKKTFTKWVNSHLTAVGYRVDDLFMDLRDGKVLLRLLEQLSGERLPKPTKGRMRIHCLENVDKALTFLSEQHVHLENVGAHDVVDGNARLTLGLIWTIILRFQIQDITVDEVDSSETRQAKDALLLWCQVKTAGYNNVNIRNFGSSWRDGLAFNAIIHKHRPDLIDYSRMSKSNPNQNLENAFRTAEERLGIARLLDPEDVNTDNPDEKCIITYVATFYHYFSRMKAETVHAKRVAKLLTERIELQGMVGDYERLVSDLLRWIEATITKLNEREFANSLAGVQQQLAAFNAYRTSEKPPKFVEKGNLEIALFSIQSRLRAANQRLYSPPSGRLLADVNSAWDALETAEHERELALRDELIRQEKLEQLAARFDRKAAMRETWLSENQKLVATDNFGTDLASVEASTKKHEAIETDISAYEERVQAVNAVANELAAENYHDQSRIEGRRENVVRLWNYLLELLAARRRRLDLSVQLHRIFQEMVYVLDWIDDITARLTTDDYGKHLLGVEDLVQKHAMLEADVHAVEERVRSLIAQAERFATGTFADVGEYRPREPAVIRERQRILESAYEELVRACNERKRRLGDSRKLWQFFGDAAEQEQFVHEREQLMSSPDLGHDLTSAHLLLNKQQAFEDELSSRRALLQVVIQRGENLIATRIFGAERVTPRINELNEAWSRLVDVTALRKKRLVEARNFYQLLTDADDCDSWMLEVLRLVSDDDCGHDESSVQSLLKKHKDVTDELLHYESVINGLEEQTANLNESDRNGSEVQSRLASIRKRYDELLELARVRKQRLLDALSRYKLFSEADSIETWISEKEKLLGTMQPGDDIEELEIIKHRFDGFEQELNAQATRVQVVNQLAKQLLQADIEHSNTREIVDRQNQLNERWNRLMQLESAKRAEIYNAYDLRQYFIEAQEATTWIRDKAKLIESTDELGDDLGGIMQLQRRLSGMERDLAAIQSKVESMTQQSEALQAANPDQAEHIREKLSAIIAHWDELKAVLQERDERLHESRELQLFLQNLDHFQVWLTKTQSTIANDDMPSDLNDAEKHLQAHQLLKDEIEAYAPDFHKMRDFGYRVTEGQTDAQYMFLRQRLEALDNGWRETAKMWDNKQNLLSQSLSLQVFLRDAKQVEVMLSQQDNLLSKEDVTNSVELVENQIRQHESFVATMDASDEKISAVVQFGEKLIDDGNYASERIQQKINQIMEKRGSNRQKSASRLQKLRNQHVSLTFLQDVNDLNEWLLDKTVLAQDDSYRGAKDIRTKFNRHQAFESEILSNRERLNRLRENLQTITRERPETAEQLRPRVDDITKQWDELEQFVKDKGQRLFDASRGVIYEQNISEIDNWMQNLEAQMITGQEQAPNLTTVTLQMKKQDDLERELKLREQQVAQLASEAETLKRIQPDRGDEIERKRTVVEQRFLLLQAPLNAKKLDLENRKRLHQFFRDVEDEKLWIAEKLPLVKSNSYGNSLLSVQLLAKKNRSLKAEIDNHEPRIASVCDSGNALIADGFPEADEIRLAMGDLRDQWKLLLEAVDERRKRLAVSEQAQQYLFDAAEAEAWMGEQELYLLSDERARDEQGAANAMKKHDNIEKTVEAYADTVKQLRSQADAMAAADHPDAEIVTAKQMRIDAMYAGLLDMMKDKRARLDEVLELYRVNRYLDDLEQWIAERIVVAGSHELGQDLEHVSMLRDRFAEFVQETTTIGTERVTAAHACCDELINAGHSDAPLIADWKDRINDSWSELCELMETRTILLQASFELHTFFNDCRETLERIVEKQASMVEEIGRDAQTAAELQRKHAAFERDLQTLGVQVQAVVDDAKELLPAYADVREREIKDERDKVLAAWRNLQLQCDARRGRLLDTHDLHKLLNMVRELQLWMDGIQREMNTQEKPRDVSGVQLLLSNHQSLKAEIDARDENFDICINLGKNLLQRNHLNADEVREKMSALVVQRLDMLDAWSDRADFLRTILEVYQFAHDAAVAECWLVAQEPYLSNADLGDSLDAVDALIKKHEAFEKSAATQEDRFAQLSKPTDFELRERERNAEEEERKRRDRAARRDHAVADFAPPSNEPTAMASDTTDGRQPVVEPSREVSSVAPTELRAEITRGISVSSSDDSTYMHVQDVSQASFYGAWTQHAATPESSEPVHYEGAIWRKHEWESASRKATSRSWHDMWIVLDGYSLSFYKDQKHFQTSAGAFYRGEPPLDLRGATASPATNYTKRTHVFRLKLSNGAEYLFQCKTQEEMNAWVQKLAESISMQGSEAGAGISAAEHKSRTLPVASSSQERSRDESATRGEKKKGFMTAKKK